MSPHLVREVKSLPPMLEEVTMETVLGIDVGKADFHCSLLFEGRARSNSFSNSKGGFERLAGWLKNCKASRVHACLESTGDWSEELGVFSR